MSWIRRDAAWSVVGWLVSLALVACLLLPLLALALSVSIDDVRVGLSDPLFGPAVALSLRTTVLSLIATVVCGTPLAWWLAVSRSRWAAAAELAVTLPVVVPPAVIGIALLQTFGRRGLLGPWLDSMGVHIPFTESAVVLAQFVVSAPLYVHAAANGFRKVDHDLLIVARTLGASRLQAFVRVALPVTLPSLVVGVSLAWARALGEFGATLLFAGNQTGTTQTMPLAIFTALESDVRVAVVFSLLLAAAAALLLVGLRLVPSAWIRWTGVDSTAQSAP